MTNLVVVPKANRSRTRLSIEPPREFMHPGLMHGSRWFLPFLVVLLVSPTLAAEEPALRAFGGQGSWLPTATGSFSYGNNKSTIGSRDTSLRLQLTPGLAYFVADRLAIGTDVNLTFSSSLDATIGGRVRTFGGGIAPNIGYAFRLHRVWTLMPKASVRYDLTRVGSQDPVTVSFGQGDFDHHRVSVGLAAWFLWHVADQVFVGLAPQVWYDVLAKKTAGTGFYSDDRRTTNVSLTLGMGVAL